MALRLQRTSQSSADTMLPFNTGQLRCSIPDDRAQERSASESISMKCSSAECKRDTAPCYRQIGRMVPERTFVAFIVHTDREWPFADVSVHFTIIRKR